MRRPKAIGLLGKKRVSSFFTDFEKSYVATSPFIRCIEPEVVKP